MSEVTTDKKIFTLLEVSQSIQRMFAAHFTSSYWIKAEMNKLGYYAQSGHCFPELVERNEGKVIARMDAFIWKDDLVRINRAFIQTTREPLKDGIKVLMLARPEYHPEYGLKLRIVEIDPSFSLGDLERERQESILKLQSEEVFSLNKKLPFPMLPKRIAVISDGDSRGYKDFLSVLEQADASWGYKIFHLLFPAALQGEKALQTIPVQLRRINKVRHYFDAVAIIRGGGGELTFSCYNNFELAKAFATFPLPVISGLGHVTNQTVVDLVAHESAITPTKCAEFIVQKFHEFNLPVQNAQDVLKNLVPGFLARQRSDCNALVRQFRVSTLNIALQKRNHLNRCIHGLIHNSKSAFRTGKDFLSRCVRSLSAECRDNLRQNSAMLDIRRTHLASHVKYFLSISRQDLMNIQKNISNMSPENVLRRGFSITRLNGQALTGAHQAKPGDEIRTLLHSGTLTSTVTPELNQQTHEQDANLQRSI